jgi:beta-galactosidase
MTPDQSRVVVTTKQRIAPPVFEWSIDAEITYTFFGDNVLIKARGRPRGLRLPPTFSRIGLEFKLKPEFNTAEWWGRGPGESYRDTKESQKFGVWRKSTDELYTPYEWPQESGNRTDVRHVTFSSSSDDQPLELKAHFGDLENASFTAHHYETTDLDCKDWRGGGHHAYELVDKKRKEVCVRLDWAHHGIGSGSCGPRPEEQYRLKVEEFEYEVLLELKDRTRTVGNEDAKGALGRIWTTLSRR